MVMWYWSSDNLIWQVSVDHNMMSYMYIKEVHGKPRLHVSANLLLEYSRHLARLHRRRCAYAPTSSTTSHDNHDKINSWVSFCFLYGYGAPLAFGPPELCYQKVLIVASPPRQKSGRPSNSWRMNDKAASPEILAEMLYGLFEKIWEEEKIP